MRAIAIAIAVTSDLSTARLCSTSPSENAFATRRAASRPRHTAVAVEDRAVGRAAEAILDDNLAIDLVRHAVRDQREVIALTGLDDALERTPQHPRRQIVRVGRVIRELVEDILAEELIELAAGHAEVRGVRRDVAKVAIQHHASVGRDREDLTIVGLVAQSSLPRAPVCASSTFASSCPSPSS